MNRLERKVLLKAMWSATISCLADGLLLLYSWRRQLFLPVSLATLVALNFLILQHNPSSKPHAVVHSEAPVTPFKGIEIIPIPLAHDPLLAIPLPLTHGQTVLAKPIALAQHIAPAHPLRPMLDNSATPSL
jgi:hypothetical protein